jgi:hypothetical protein
LKLDQDDSLEAQGVFSQPREFTPEALQPPQIVGEVANPVLETVRRLWWRGFDRVYYCVVLIRLSIHDRICGPEPPPTAAD